MFQVKAKPGQAGGECPFDNGIGKTSFGDEKNLLAVALMGILLAIGHLQGCN